MLLCRAMHVHRSGYYNWLTRGESRTCRENKKMIPVIQAVHAARLLVTGIVNFIFDSSEGNRIFFWKSDWLYSMNTR